MPNHISTILEIRGDRKQLKAFVKALKTGKKVKNPWSIEEVDEYDFDRLLPMPKELEGTQSPTTILTEEEYLKAVEDFKKKAKDLSPQELANMTGIGITQAMSDDYKKRFGFDNWYAWRNAMYGTKWGMYEVSFDGIKGNTAFFSYQTAWSPATAYFVNISPQFPDLEFKHMFADEGGGFLGYEVIKNGVIKESTELEWDSDRGIALREDLGCYSPEDEEEVVGILENK